MTDAVVAAIITSTGAFIVSVVGCVAALVAASRSKKNAAAIQEVHISLNSRLQELIEASRAVGQIQERDDHRERNKTPPTVL